MNAPLTAKGSSASLASSCTSGSHFSAHTSLPWQIHKSLAKEAAMPLPVSEVIFLRWITLPFANSHRSNEQVRHWDIATGLWRGWWRWLSISWEPLGPISPRQIKSQWVAPLDLSGKIYGGERSYNTFQRQTDIISVCQKINSQVFLGGLSTLWQIVVSA